MLRGGKSIASWHVPAAPRGACVCGISPRLRCAHLGLLRCGVSDTGVCVATRAIFPGDCHPLRGFLLAASCTTHTPKRRLANEGVKKSAVREREERRTVRSNTERSAVLQVFAV